MRRTRLQGRVQSAGVPAELVASSQYSKDALVPPLEARQIAASGRPAKGMSTDGRAALNQQQAGPQAGAPAVRSAADEWREEMYKDDLEARTAGTSISSGKGLGALGSLGASLPSGGVGSVLQQLLGEYPKAGSGGNAGGPSPSLMPANAGSGDQSDANLQEHKENFIEKAREGREERDYSSATRAPALSKYEIKAGWDIPATLESGVNTDLPGEVKAVVRENVYDTATGQYLLIPQGSRLIGQYDNRVSYGQSRAIVIWSRLIFPDGSSVDLDGMVGHDASGAGGFHDQVDNHYLRLVSMALLLSAFTAGIEMSQPQTTFGVGCLVAERGSNSSPWPAVRAVGHGGDAKESEYPTHSEDSSWLSVQCARESRHCVRGAVCGYRSWSIGAHHGDCVSQRPVQ